MQIKFSREVDTVAGYARDEAMRTGWYGIGIDHLFLGILRHSDNDVCMLLRGLEVDLDEVKDYLDSRLMQKRPVPYNDFDSVRLTGCAQNIMSLAVYEALKYGSREVLVTHLFLAMIRSEESCIRAWLNDLDYNYRTLGAMMAEQDMLGASPEPAQVEKKETPDKPVDLSGALSEQLRNLFESCSSNSNTIS